MDEICRLCCSNRFVNNYIFDEENALYLKMSLYLPIKVFKNDRLPQKICDRCSCKVNDFYQFCNETIEVQNRLRAVLLSSAVEVEDSIDLTLIKSNDFSPLPHNTNPENEIKPITDPSQSNIPPLLPLFKEPDASTNQNQYPEPTTNHSQYPGQSTNQNPYSGQSTNQTQYSLPSANQIQEKAENPVVPQQQKETRTQSTQTEGQTTEPTNEINMDVPLPPNVQIKQEPKMEHEVKMESDFGDDMFYSNLPSDNSEDDRSLIQFKKKKSKKVKVANGKMDKRKKKKNNLKEWEKLMLALPEGTALSVVDDNQPDVKVDVKQELAELGAHPVKSEPVEFHCVVCFVQCYSRAEMLHHYKQHGAAAEALPTPPAPPLPDGDTEIKCMRCQKRIDRDSWPVHWGRHWEKDRRPYRCSLCEKTFRDHHQILKHGLSHKWGEEPTEPAVPPEKRFVCDVCPESFVYMRYLLAHRATAHPEAATRALMLRCAVCDRQFAHLNSLRRHLRAHTGERNFLCNICGKALSSREHLKFHIRIHTGYKPNVCKTCGKGFVKKCNLTLHERVHSGERPHVCPHCGKAFSQRSTLVIHERYHSGARPYVCGLCHRGFVAKGLLSMHLKTTCI